MSVGNDNNDTREAYLSLSSWRHVPVKENWETQDQRNKKDEVIRSRTHKYKY